MNAWSWKLVGAVVILASLAAPAEAARVRSHGPSFTHHTGFFSGSTSGGFSVSPHKTRVFFGDFTSSGFFFPQRTHGDFFFRRNLFFRRIVVLNPGPVPPFNGTSQFFSGTIVPPFSVGTPINSFFIPRFFSNQNNGFTFGFFSSGFRDGRFNTFFAPVGLTGGSGNATVVLLVNPSPAIIPASVQLAGTPASPTKAQIVVLHTWSGTDKVKIFSPGTSAQAGSRTAMQIAEVPAQ